LDKSKIVFQDSSPFDLVSDRDIIAKTIHYKGLVLGQLRISKLSMEQTEYLLGKGHDKELMEMEAEHKFNQLNGLEWIAKEYLKDSDDNVYLPKAVIEKVLIEYADMKEQLDKITGYRNQARARGV